jgi:hypothetical protein
MESMENAGHQDLSRRPALMISRIVSRSLYDVPLNNIGPAFSARGPQAQAFPFDGAPALSCLL